MAFKYLKTPFCCLKCQHKNICVFIEIGSEFDGKKIVRKVSGGTGYS
jgi:hypothetical protein